MYSFGSLVLYLTFGTIQKIEELKSQLSSETQVCSFVINYSPYINISVQRLDKVMKHKSRY